MYKARRRSLSILVICSFLGAIPAVAQSDGESLPENRFVLSGYGFTTYVDPGTLEDPESFSMAFVPIFLFRVSDKFLFEGELEFEYDDGELETGVEYAQIDWIANDYLTVVAGKYLTPFGSFIERIHPAWINKLPTFPLPYQHGKSLIPFSQTGVQIRGAAPLGDGYGRFTYTAYVSNGFQAAEHGDDERMEDPPLEDEEGDAGLKLSEARDEGVEPVFLGGSSANSNDDLAFGGRVSILPAQGFEIGASYLSGTYDEMGTLDATAFGLDFNYHHDLWDFRAEWIDSDIDLGIAEDGDVLGSQQVNSWYVQPSLRLSLIPVYFFNKVEFVVRYANMDFGDSDQDQTSVGFNYYFNGSTVFRIAWERLEETDRESNDSLNMMLAIGF